MPVESAADRAAFFNREEFAEAALYTPPVGAPVVCTVIADRGQGREAMRAGPMEAAGADRLIQVLAEGAAEDGLTPERGGTFDLFNGVLGDLAETLEVVGVPRLDETAVWWTVEVVEAG